MRLLFISLFLFHSIFGMDNVQKDLVIPDVFKEHSGLLKMLADKKNDFLKNPLKLPDGEIIQQNQLDDLAQTYKPDFEHDQLSADELVSLANYHNYFQMDFSIITLKNTLENKLKDGQITWKDVQLLDLDWKCFLYKRLDAQFLKLYSDFLIAQREQINNNIPFYNRERLLFFDDTKKLYGAYRKLVLKNNGIIQKDINFRLEDDYRLVDIIVHADGLYAIVSYSDKADIWRKVFDLIDITSQEVISDLITQESKEMRALCCFGGNNVYSALCNDVSIIIKSLNLFSRDQQDVVKIQRVANQKLVDITSNKNGNYIVVATQKQLFIIKINSNNDICTKVISCDDLCKNDISIKKVSLNNNGNMLCVVMGLNRYDVDNKVTVYLYDLTDPEVSVMNITKELKGNHYNLQKYDWEIQPCLVDIENILWNDDDSLLILKCFYRYQKWWDGIRYGSFPAGEQYAFVCPVTGNGWSENELRKYKYNKPYLVTSHDGTAIITDDSGWFIRTYMLHWYDENMIKALHYFDIKKPNDTFSVDKNFMGIFLLHKILQNKEVVMQLDKEETEIYMSNLPDTIKTMLTKIKSILLYKENMFWLSSLKRFLYVFGMRGKHFLYEYRKPLFRCKHFLYKYLYKYREPLLFFLGLIILNCIYDYYYPFDILYNPYLYKDIGLVDFIILKNLIRTNNRFC